MLGKESERGKSIEKNGLRCWRRDRTGGVAEQGIESHVGKGGHLYD
jgi:hypothetical protein